jgi:hypothetical protein
VPPVQAPLQVAPQPAVHLHLTGSGGRGTGTQFLDVDEAGWQPELKIQTLYQALPEAQPESEPE